MYYHCDCSTIIIIIAVGKVQLLKNTVALIIDKDANLMSL